MHSIFSTVASFALLVAGVLGAFVYVSSQAGYIGASFIQVTPAIAKEMHLAKPQGFLVEQVDPHGPAADAGMRGGTAQVVIGDQQVIIGGDVITGVDHHAINGRADLINNFKDKQIGDNILFTVLRDNSTQEINVKVAKNPVAPFP